MRAEDQGDRRRLRASLQDVGDPYGHGQQVVPETGLGISQVCLGQTCSTSTNRLVRTRMLGGVGGRGQQWPRLPDWRLPFDLTVRQSLLKFLHASVGDVGTPEIQHFEFSQPYKVI